MYAVPHPDDCWFVPFHRLLRDLPLGYQPNANQRKEVIMFVFSLLPSAWVLMKTLLALAFLGELTTLMPSVHCDPEDLLETGSKPSVQVPVEQIKRNADEVEVVEPKKEEAQTTTKLDNSSDTLTFTWGDVEERKLEPTLADSAIAASHKGLADDNDDDDDDDDDEPKVTKLRILYGTKTGTTRRLAKNLKGRWDRATGQSAEIVDLEEFEPEVSCVSFDVFTFSERAFHSSTPTPFFFPSTMQHRTSSRTSSCYKEESTKAQPTGAPSCSSSRRGMVASLPRALATSSVGSATSAKTSAGVR